MSMLTNNWSFFDMPVHNFFQGCGAIAGGIMVSAAIVSYFVYNKTVKCVPLKDNKEDEEEEYKRQARETREKKAAYGQKWFDELDELEDRKLTEEELVELKNKTISLDTPEGEVLMYYNQDTESFWYYSDNKNVSNRTLDAVARKYTITHNCKQVCVNHKKEIANVQKKLCDMLIKHTKKKDKKDDDSKNNDDINDVFVKPKITPKKLIKRSGKVIVERVNRFTYKGKISDISDKKDGVDDDKETNVNAKMTFKEYKEYVESLKKKKE